ncbi:MAG: cell division protein SepF [Microcystaceae cyanobacterium]
MILTKLKDFVGISEQDEYDEEYEEMDWEQYQDDTNSTPAPQPPIESPLPPRRSPAPDLNLTPDTGVGTTTPRNNVIGMPGITNNNAEVVVVEPHSFEEMPQVIQTLRERKSVVLNLNVMDPEEAQRAVDFIAGGTYAIDGHQERIGESIFLFTPSCVKVSTLTGSGHDHGEVPVAPPQPSASVAAWGVDPSRLAQ